ncbi:MAG: NifB/NifX family molybdenum-iron cluster-binding protein [Deltaproteobacteria bacterium]|nr:NifB/NifX family molybdenum-iron cluster-binding protein [Deltaproteobacteria bacterium]
MKIAFPVEENKGLDSPVYGHFGSAPWFVLMDAQGGDLEAVTNEDHHHEHGQCQPGRALGGRPVDAVVVGGIGAGALRKLQAEGVRVFRGVEGSVRENLDLLNSGKLPEFAFEMTCAGHRGGEGGCRH